MIDKQKSYNHSKESNKRKAEQLGMSSYGKARNILNNSILFKLVKDSGENICYRCKQPITDTKNLTVDHKEPYLYSENATELFFDLDNVAFSHKSCNCKNTRSNDKSLRPNNELNLDTNKIKEKYLGMSYGKARNILNNDLLFTYVKKTGNDICFQCGEKILNKDELSVEHKEPFMYSDDPKKLFFDLNNVAFSHKSCNYKASRKNEGPCIKKISRDSMISQSGYKGVRHRTNRPTKYYSKLVINGKSIYIGSSNDPKELAELYDKKAIELLGEEAITNKKLGLL